MKTIHSGWELKVLAVIAIVVCIAISQPVLFPILFAFFLYLLLNPVLEWMVSFKVPKPLGAVILVLALLGLISWGVSFLVDPAASWIESAPTNFKIVEKKALIIKKSLGKIIKAAETAQDISDVVKDDTIKLSTETTSLGSSLFTLTSNALFLISTILLLLFFFLIYFKPLLQSFEKIIYNRRKIREEESEFILELKSKVSRYMLVFTLICAGLGVVMACALGLLGLPNALLWGMMAMVLTYIPYVGHLVGIIVVSFVSLVTFDSYLGILSPPITYLLIAVLEGQVVTPILLGNRLNLNPLIVFINMFFWGWLWGISGVIISIPLLVTIKIIIEYVPDLAKYKSLLESEVKPPLLRKKQVN